MKSHCLASALLLLFGAVPGAFSADEPQLRGVAISSEDHLSLKVFDTSEDFDLIDGHDEDSYFYQQTEDEYDEESFATATRGIRPLVKHCFRWHTDAACRNGGRAGRCRDDWTEKCTYCERGEEADSMTGECVSSSDDDDKKVERCFRWHNSAACRNGGRAGYCSRSWTEKCIMCMKDQEVNKRTGECVSISDDDKKVERCFRWHNSAACRNGGRAGYCSRSWTEKCIMCKKDQEVNKRTGECVSISDDDKKVERCFRWHNSAACRNGGRAGYCSRSWTEKCIMCKKDQEVNKMTGECAHNKMYMKEA
ncbi:hypothetical protein QTG54_015599 [Skeletonema marinoi]|uniref:ShKT domain-containing protein n=1 Tax=Skeletonema marinoi TaxID=267567 RepID=A0AAD8XUB9_9STRA|nr:hypothetical protein QTG54_015599 [Skeletonema marinoi]